VEICLFYAAGHSFSLVDHVAIIGTSDDTMSALSLARLSPRIGSECRQSVLGVSSA
jgi:hypothetical protein